MITFSLLVYIRIFGKWYKELVNGLHAPFINTLI